MADPVKDQASSDEGLIAVEMQRVQARTSVANHSIRWGALSFISLMGYLCVRDLAGQSTDANIFIGLVADAKVVVSVAWIAAGAALAHAGRERKLRKDATERLGRRIKELEEHIDSKRSSSRLTPRGDTSPGDKL